jgi:type II secretory pathway pseudopilin PulG
MRNHSQLGERGLSLLELVFAAGLLSTAAAAALPSLARSVDEGRALGATRHLAGRLQEARLEAVKRSVSTAVRFVHTADGYTYALHVDGNGDGMRQHDIARGVDWELRSPERLSAEFPRVDFGALAGLPGPDPATTPPGDDPIRIGNTDLLTFTPLGTATSGTLYVRSSGGVQYAVRVLGQTGRVRILRFNAAHRRWGAL